MFSVLINNQEKELKFGEGRLPEVDGIPFDGHRVLWSYSYEPSTYLKESELSGDEWRRGGCAKIFRNGVCVLNEFCREPERALRIFAWHLPLLEEFPFECLEVGRKVYHAGVPSIVDRICDDGEIILRTEDGKPYEIYGHKHEDKKEDGENFIDEWKDKDRVHFLDKRIFWHRT